MSQNNLVFRVFFSSTFGDMREERDRLQVDVFPKIRTFCEERGAQFQPIDLRWGISEEAGTDHRTMAICLEELHRCQKITPKPNFILMLGERYGWRPLPAQIFADEFGLLLNALDDLKDTSGKSEIQHWYQLDENAIPLDFVLQARAGEFADYSNWEPKQAELRSILQRAAVRAFADDDPRRNKYFDSATHQEIRHGALQAVDAHEHVFCYLRDFDTLPSPGDSHGSLKGKDFIDVTLDGKSLDQDSHDRQASLKDELRKHFGPAGHVRAYKAKNYHEPSEVRIKDLCRDIEVDLKTIIEQQIAANLATRQADKSGTQAVTRSHAEFGAERRRNFVGRDDVLSRIEAYVGGSDNHPFVVCGPGGSGKTALVAEASWRTSSSSKSDTAPVVVTRFIGSDAPSSEIRTLLADLCSQIAHDFDVELKSLPSELHDLVSEFEKQLQNATVDRPLVLFLDAFDQFNPTDGAHYLGWLPRELPAGVKVVLSVLVPEDTEGKDDRAICYRVAKSRPSKGNFFDLSNEPMTREQGERLLAAWMSRAGRRLEPWEHAEISDQRGERRTGRTLTESQQNHVLDEFATHSLPLWLKLAFEEVRHWHSYEKELPKGHDQVPGLSPDVSGILRDLFFRLQEERNHGKVLVSRALGYIGAARRGLAEDELLAVLSHDEDVMADFVKRSPTELAKKKEERLLQLPMLIWSRLYADLEPYLSNRGAYGATVLNFYHRQVGEEVHVQFLNENERERAHRNLADYFRQLDYFRESLDAQRARAKRLPPTPRPVNIRKVDELPFHVLEVAKLAGGDNATAPEWDAVADLLTDWQFLEAKAEAQPFAEPTSAVDASESVEGN